MSLLLENAGFFKGDSSSNTLSPDDIKKGEPQLKEDIYFQRRSIFTGDGVRREVARPGEKYIVLTFDDGPEDVVTKALLDFFAGLREGKVAVVVEILETHLLMKRYTGEQSTYYFRAPGGAWYESTSGESGVAQSARQLAALLNCTGAQFSSACTKQEIEVSRAATEVAISRIKSKYGSHFGMNEILSAVDDLPRYVGLFFGTLAATWFRKRDRLVSSLWPRTGRAGEQAGIGRQMSAREAT